MRDAGAIIADVGLLTRCHQRTLMLMFEEKTGYPGITIPDTGR